MFHHRSFHALALMLTLAGILTAGCAKEADQAPAPGAATSPTAETGEAGGDEYNPHDVPITEEQKAQLRQETAQFVQAVAKIKQLRDETEAETKDGIPENPYKAHQALDRADLVLQWLPEIASTSGVPKDRWEEVTTTANDLRGLFEKVHQNIDNKRNPDFAAVAADIDGKIASLEAIAQAQPVAADASSTGQE